MLDNILHTLLSDHTVVILLTFSGFSLSLLLVALPFTAWPIRSGQVVTGLRGGGAIYTCLLQSDGVPHKPALASVDGSEQEEEERDSGGWVVIERLRGTPGQINRPSQPADRQMCGLCCALM